MPAGARAEQEVAGAGEAGGGWLCVAKRPNKGVANVCCKLLKVPGKLFAEAFCISVVTVVVCVRVCECERERVCKCVCV